MATNKRKQSSKTPYLLEVDGKQYGSYQDYDVALDIARSIQLARGAYCVIRRGDEKVWES